jgi:hypothetical protein
MKNKPFFFILILFFFAFFLLPLQNIKAAESLDVVINEVAWIGTANSANDEWLELYNNTASVISLDGWNLNAEDGTPTIKLKGNIPANGFFLLERTDDITVAEIKADLIYKGGLGNNGENLKLFDNSGNIIDEVNCSGGWLAGDNTKKQTMERKTDFSWQTSQIPGGTPKAQNSQGQEKITTVQKQEKAKNTKTNPVKSASASVTEPEKELAAVGEQIPKKSSSLAPVFLISSAIAIFSGGIILIIKKSLKNKL